VDTLAVPTKPELIAEPSDAQAKQSKSYRTKSPGVAVLLSAVFPGAGQIYNESYWKPPVIWGLGGYWLSQWIDLNKKYQDYRGQYEANPVGVNSEQIKRVRDFYHDERDRFAWYLGLLYFVNLLDAYVGAHLYDFDVGDELNGLRLVIRPSALSVQWRF